jgi:hypothetical protein
MTTWRVFISWRLLDKLRRDFRKVLFPDLLESVIPECFYRESRRDRNWTPD